MNRTIVWLVPFCLLILFSRQQAAAGVNVSTVTVGTLGNPTDPLTGNQYGSVSYAYNIGKYEVTIGQYAAFLNAVAASDTYGLYNASMGTDLNIAGITQNGSTGNYSYSVVGSPNRPITYVSWGDAARFANWINNKQPVGLEGIGTTETGAYTLNGAVTDAALNAVSRNAAQLGFFQPQMNGTSPRITIPLRDTTGSMPPERTLRRFRLRQVARLTRRIIMQP